MRRASSKISPICLRQRERRKKQGENIATRVSGQKREHRPCDCEYDVEDKERGESREGGDKRENVARLFMKDVN